MHESGGDESRIGRTFAAWTKKRPASKNRRFPSASGRREIDKLCGGLSSSFEKLAAQVVGCARVEMAAGGPALFGGWSNANEEHLAASCSSALAGVIPCQRWCLLLLERRRGRPDFLERLVEAAFTAALPEVTESTCYSTA